MEQSGEPVQATAEKTSTRGGFRGGKRGGKRQSPSQRAHGKQRNEEYRGKKADEANERRTQALRDKLFFGFRECSAQALANMQVVTVDRNMIVPVSTRAVGFMSQFLFCKFARLQVKIPITSTVYALYRVSLLQLEVKVQRALEHQSSRSTGRGFKYSDIDGRMVRRLGQLGANFSPFVNLIAAVGVFRCYGCQYVPRIAEDPLEDDVRVPEATTVTFSNLNRVVRLLSLPSTNVEMRRRFYEANPLPGAIWGGRPAPGDHRKRNRFADELAGDFPLLMNPEDFMWDQYSVDDLASDIACVEDLLEVVGRKFPKYVSEVHIDNDAQGHPNQLVSNKPGTIRCVDLPVEGSVNRKKLDFNISVPVRGDIDGFWSPERLSDGEFYVGMLHLLGECPTVQLPENYAMRSPYSGKQECDGDYVTILQNFVA